MGKKYPKVVLTFQLEATNKAQIKKLIEMLDGVSNG